MFQANEKDTKYGFSPDGEKFLVDSLHAGVLTAHSEWSTGACATEAFSFTCAL